MTPELLTAVLNFAVKFGIDAAIAISGALKGGATVDDAINALQEAKTKTAQDYLNQAKAIAP